VLELDQSAFVVNSFSKYFGMTGWRLGWIVVPDDYIEMATILAQNLYISASSIAQNAALAAFTPEAKTIFEERRHAFRQRRDYLAAALKDIGFSLSDNIQGAFYIYADISRFSDDCEEFCRDMLEEHGVALTPGTDFGDFESKRHVRIAFTTDMDSLELGVERLSKALL
jgi:aspartate/methionine/tyrosine aminotransferase